MTGFGVWKRAGAWLVGAAMLPALAIAQTTPSAPQTDPSLDRFSLPPTVRPSPKPTPPTSGPIVAPLSRPMPTTPAATPTPAPVLVPTPTWTPRTPAKLSTRAPVAPPARRPTPSAAPVPTSTAPTAAPTGATVLPDATAAPVPVASPTSEATASVPVSAEQPTTTWPTGLLVAAGAGLLALVAIGGFLLGRRRSVRGPEAVEEVAPVPAALSPAPEPPSGHVTVPVRRRVVEETAPRLEITLIPKRAGTNLTSAAVDYRVVIRNVGAVAARDIRFAMYMLSASGRQAQDLQMIFAANTDQPLVAPFELAPGQDLELSGMAMLPREQVNVMNIDGKPWFVPVLAMKADYRWGENVGAPGVATAAHMIGIDRGEGAKMAPFRLDGSPHMHPEVAERKVV